MRTILTDQVTRSGSLPVPDEPAKAHSERLREQIREEIKANGGGIGFDRYMEMALYEPGRGYYSAGAGKFEEAGDFTTAPLISPIFSRCLARQCAQVLSASLNCIVELGAGSGVMAADMLLELKAIHAMPDKYLILERSADLRARQKALLGARVPHLLAHIEWLDGLPDAPVNGVLIANEVIDALPVKRILLDKNSIREMCVSCDKGEFYWQARPADETLMQHVTEIKNQLGQALPAPYLTEMNMQLPAWIKSLAAILNKGMMLFIDYGYTRGEYYHPQRVNGALLCHYRHRYHDDPFLYPGLQDITASVDFTALADAALANNMQLAGYTTQAHFLIGCGLERIAGADQHNRHNPSLAVSRQIKLLTLPGEMGERFKAIAFSKNMTGQLRGFKMDQQHRLWQR